MVGKIARFCAQESSAHSGLPEAPSAEQDHMKRHIVHLFWILACFVAIAYPASAQEAPSETSSLTAPEIHPRHQR
jgi:hypothetical protein